MPEDDVIRVGMEGDPSSYLAALNKMQSETKKVLGELEVKYADSMAKIAMSTNALQNAVASVNRKFGEGAAQLPAYSSATQKYTDEVIRQTKAAQELKLQIIETNKALEQQTRDIASAQSMVRAYNTSQRTAGQPIAPSATPGVPPPNVVKEAAPGVVTPLPIESKSATPKEEASTVSKPGGGASSIADIPAIPVAPAKVQTGKPLPVNVTTPTGTPVPPSTQVQSPVGQTLGPTVPVPRYEEALNLTKGRERISQSVLQKEMGIGYGHADKLITALEDEGIIGPGAKGGRGREVLKVEPATTAPPAAPPPSKPPAAPPSAPPPGDDEEKRKQRIVEAQSRKPSTPPPPEPHQVPVGAPPSQWASLSSVNDFSKIDRTKKSLDSILTAQQLVERQSLTLGEIEKSVSSSIGMSAQEMAGLYVRSTTEMRIASAALINAQKELGPAAAKGAPEAIKTIDSLEKSYIKASTVSSKVADQIKQLQQTEKAAAESTTGLSTATQQRVASTELLARQEQTLNSIRTEGTKTTAGAAEVQALHQRALTESRIAVSALSNAQKNIGPAAAQGDNEAIAALNNFETAYNRARGTVMALKERLDVLTGSNIKSAETTDQAALAAERLAKAEEIATRQASTLIALQREVAASSGTTAREMGAAYVRATTEMQVAASSLAQSQRDIGPAAAEGDAVAQAALDSLSQSYTNASGVVADLKLQISQLSEAEAAAAESAAAQQTVTNQLASAQTAAARQSLVLNEIQQSIGKSASITSSQLGSVYVRAASEARLASTNLAQAQRLIGPAAAAGNAEAIQALQILEKSYQEASAYAELLKLQINTLSQAEETNAGAAVKNAEAHALEAQALRAGATAAVVAAGGYEELGYSSYKAMASSRALASEAGLGGVGYAISRVASMSKALGPLLEAALPVALFIGIGEAIVGVSEKAYELYQNFILIKREMDEIDKMSEKMGKDVETAFARGEEAAISHLKRMGLEVDAAKRKVSLEESKPIDLTFGLKTDKDFEEKLKDLSHSQRERAKGVFKEIIPAELPDELEEVNLRLDEVNYGIANIQKKRQEIVKEAGSFPGSLTLNPYAQGELGQLRRQENQFNVQRSMYDRLRQVITAHMEARKNIVVEEEDQISEAADRKLIESTNEQIEIMKANGTYTKAAEIAKWRGILEEVQKGGAEYREIEKKIGTASGKGPTDRQRESEIRKQDQDTLTEIRLHASEIEEIQSVTLSKEEAFVRSRIAQEKRYVDNVRSLRAELVRILHEEEAQRIKSETEHAGSMYNAEGKPDYSGQADYWNQIATDSMHAKNSVEEFTNAMERARRAGGEAIRQISEDIRKDVIAQYETWITESHRTESEVLKFWEGVKTKYASDAPLVEEAISRVAAATQKLREETIKLKEVMAQRQETVAEGGAEMRKAGIKREYEINPQTPDFNPFGDNAADKERKALATIELEEIQDKKNALQAKLDAVKATDGEESNEYQKLINEKIKLDQQYNLKSYEIETANIEARKQKYQQYFDTINKGTERLVDDIIDGNKKWTQDFRRMIEDLEKQFANFIIKTTLMWAEAKFIKWLTGAPVVPNKSSQEAQGERPKTPIEHIPVVGGVLGKIFGGSSDPHAQLVTALNKNTDAVNHSTAAMGGAGAVGGGGTVTPQGIGSKLVSMALVPTSFFKNRDAGTTGLQDTSGPIPGVTLPGAPAYTGRSGAGVLGAIAGGALSIGTGLLGIGKGSPTAVGSAATLGSGGGGMTGALNTNTQVLTQVIQSNQQLVLALQQHGQQSGGGQGSGGDGGAGLLNLLTGQGGQGGQGGAGSATNTAQTIAQNSLLTTSNVFTAAGIAFETTMAGVPFPANLAAAPAAGAQVLAEGAPYIVGASMEKGGIVPVASGKTFPTILHGQEMVLPERISKHVMESVSPRNVQAPASMSRGELAIPERLVASIQSMSENRNHTDARVSHSNQHFELNYTPRGPDRAAPGDARNMMKEVRRMSRTFNR